MRIIVAYCRKCDHPMLPAAALDKFPHLAGEYRRPATNGYLCRDCQMEGQKA